VGTDFLGFFSRVIAILYLSFAAYFGATTRAWETEIVGVAVFLACAVGGLSFRPAIAAGYVIHGLWDLSHCLFGSSLAGLPLTEIPRATAFFVYRTILRSRVIS
jgi:hypothetical protein